MPEPVLLRTGLPLPGPDARTVHWAGARGCATALCLAEFACLRNGPLLVLTPNVADAEALAAELRFFSPAELDVLLFPDLEVLPYDSFSPHQDLVAERLRVLRDLMQGGRRVVLAAAPTLLPHLPPPTYLRARGIELHAGQRLDPAEFRRQLDDAGYQRVSQVSTHGEYAVRGSLVDLYPTGSNRPVRVDFLDDDVESIREFDPDSQLTTGRVDTLDTLPAREIPIDAEAVKAFRLRYRARFEGNPANSVIYREVSEQRLPAGVENYLPLFFEQAATFWDYLPADTCAVCVGDPASALEVAWQQVNERYEQCRQDTERPALAPAELYVAPAQHLDALQAREQLLLDTAKLPAEMLTATSTNLAVQPAPTLLVNRRDEDPSSRLREFLAGFDGRLLISAESPGRRELLLEALRPAGLNPAELGSWTDFAAGEHRAAIVVAPLHQGFLIADHELAVLTETEFFGEQPRRRRRRRVQDPESLINDLTDLRPGAPVVHAEHGVGRYVGLSRLDIDNSPAEFVTLEYAGGDRLHVPVGSLNLISRYTGAAPEHAPLHRLGTDQWLRARKKAADKVRDAAAELLEIYAQRASRGGQSARIDPGEYRAFAAGFAFEPTDDQGKAIDDVLADLAGSAPMDRLVCGDVGFGKTEVALRAAFVAVNNGRQVAILVPTTLLAQQHYQTFTDRFADTPVTVAGLSRFQGTKASREVVAGLAAGSVDIVVGTHRLLQKGIEFKQLGLVIIDEEHRFGVRHKERLKALRTQADFLTLTATPIPRTLNMALGGLRDLSLITTPPESRLSIKTFVTQWRDQVIREACQRELKRGGQVYFVHNRIEDIEDIAEKVASLVPEARIEVAHGQMRERDLERIMLDFYHRRFHVLVCTAIIESGLDVPTANTIVINRADRFGLAQLHQLRGRVGRSHHQAFAYLLAPAREAMTDDAVKRLDAIESLEDLGAGFVLATHDLEIRGAGELLGEEQSGQIQEIGFTLYNEMLARTVEALRAGLEPDPEGAGEQTTEINLHLPALIPDDYMPDVHLRLVHYKRIASAANDEALKDLQVELVDRFGLIPPATRNLFRLTQLRLRAAALGLKRIEMSAGGGRVEFGPHTAVDPLTVVNLIQAAPDRYRFDSQQRLRVTADVESPDARYTCVEQLLEDLAAGPPAMEQTASGRRA
ncbi:MAG: transcription-repair coupling factor [Chromatiales bacterium]|nr:MAG: transcription-repair coupling factor [Chromatiales bacterium]